ncbi:Alpha-type protein kinase domain-containing protein [Balamuthia mandrillaris]
MVRRHCADCGRHLEPEAYSSNQWRRGVGASRCSACVHGSGRNEKHGSAAQLTKRCNRSFRAHFRGYDLRYPFAQGAFRWVAKGEYTTGKRKGEPCVCKWFKRGHVFEEHFFEHDIKAVNKAAELIHAWNCAGFISKLVKLNVPQVWTFAYSEGNSWSNRKVLVEPYVENWQKFNSNTGWVSDDDVPWHRVMQALSHFSYHASGGQFVLCDLQGGVYSNGVVLSDPVILSRTRRYGLTDLGPEGISSFFSTHCCNEFCRSSWATPVDQNAYYEPEKGTTMEYVPTRHSRPAASRMYRH